MKSFYKSRVDSRFECPNILSQAGKSIETKIDDFCFEVGHYIKLLEPEVNANKYLLNVGCGNGLHNLLLHPFYRKITCIDINKDMLERCKTICRNLDNIDYYCMSAVNVIQTIDKPLFDHIMMLGVVTIVDDHHEAFSIFESLSMVVKSPGRLIIGRICDLLLKRDYISSLPNILKAKSFSDESIIKIVEDNDNANWFTENEIWEYFKKKGAIKYTRVPCNIQHIGHECQFDMRIDF